MRTIDSVVTKSGIYLMLVDAGKHYRFIGGKHGQVKMLKSVTDDMRLRAHWSGYIENNS